MSGGTGVEPGDGGWRKREESEQRRRENLPKSPEGKTEAVSWRAGGSLFFTPPPAVSPPSAIHPCRDLSLLLGGKSKGGTGSRGVRSKGLQRGSPSSLGNGVVVGCTESGYVQ